MKNLGSKLCLAVALAFASSAFAPTPGSADDRINKCEFRAEAQKFATSCARMTRDYVHAVSACHASADLYKERLLTLDQSLVTKLALFYGDDQVAGLTPLITERVTLLSDYATVTLKRNAPGLEAARAALLANSDATVTIMSDLNPNWVLADLQAMHAEQVALLDEQLTAQLAQDWAADIAAADKAEAAALKFADYMSAGLIKQFPGKFSLCGCS